MKPFFKLTIRMLFVPVFSLYAFASGTKAKLMAPNEAIVILKDTKSATLAARHLKSYKVLKSVSGTNRGKIALVHSDLPTGTLIEKLKNDPNVIAAYPNYRRKLSQIPDDDSFSKLWGLHNTAQAVNGTSGSVDADIDAPEAWDRSTGSRDYVVAVIDTGVDYTHEDISANIWKNPGEIPGNGADDDSNGYMDDYYGYDFAADDNGGNDGDPMDFIGHGTHVAGTIGAEGNNAKGITGINWNVSIMALKAARPDGGLYDSDILEAIEYILTMKSRGVNIVSVNASYGGGGGSQGDAVNIAIDALGSAGIIFVTAAGNESSNIDISPSYPASYTSANIIGVAATDQTDSLAYFSNYGKSSVDLAAPGVDIYSSLPGGDYVPKNGDIFFDDMESSDAKWTHTGTNDSWQITSESVQSGSFAWSDSPGGDYNASSDSTLSIKNPIDLSGYDPAVDHIYFAFWAKFIIENIFDYLWVEFSADGGNSWQKIDGKSDTIFSDNWALYKYTVPEKYWTDSFMFRFHFTSDFRDEYDGVYLDDIGLGRANPANYEFYGGTSMATPHVAGSVALVRSLYPNKSVAEIKSRILNNVDPLSSLFGKVSTGGRLNIDKALANHSPNALDDAATTDINRSITIDVLSNDSDPDGEILSIEAIVSAPVHGNASIAGSKILYTPQNGYDGNDSFRYRVDDGSGGSGEASVSITVGRPSNSAPAAGDDSARTTEGEAVTIDILANDSDPDGDTISILSVTQPAHGSTSIKGSSVIYTPTAGFTGTDSFEYSIGDGRGATDTARVSVTVDAKPSGGGGGNTLFGLILLISGFVIIASAVTGREEKVL